MKRLTEIITKNSVLFVIIAFITIGISFIAVHAFMNTDDSTHAVKATRDTGKFFAEKWTTNTLYPVGCPEGDNVKERNRIYFFTEQEALEAGYKISRKCIAYEGAQ